MTPPPRAYLIPSIAGLVLIGLCARARAAETNLPYGFTCEQVRSYVAVHGRWKALAWAVEQGASVAQLAAARRCLNQSPLK